MPSNTPKRLLVVLPSWVGDAVMATPTLRSLRRAMPGAFIGALARPGIDDVLLGSPFIDEFHIDRAVGMMGPKRVAAKLRAVRYDAALLLTNSFSTALVTRLAGIPERIGYDRDGRAVLLTTRLAAPKRRDRPPFDRSQTNPGDWAPIPACAYYFSVASHAAGQWGVALPPMGPMELWITESERDAARGVLEAVARATGAGGDDRAPLVFLNPGANDEAKRWPAERFAALAEALVEQDGARVLVSGSPGEAELTASIVGKTSPRVRERVVDLAPMLASAAREQASAAGPTVGPLSLLKVVIQRCGLMVTNDTGPRHIASALGVPVVSLFGPTDHRWTTIGFEHERMILADPTLPPEEVANDHPERCSMQRIDLASVLAASRTLLNPGDAVRAGIV